MLSRTLLMATATVGLLLAMPPAQSQNKPTQADQDAGQLNRGAAHQPPAPTPPVPRADHEDVRAALMMPDPGTISTGEQPDMGAKAQPETTGKGITSGEQAGPIGSSMQTKPAKFSHRNDAIDHTPIMGMPFKLDAQQRQRVFKTVMEQDAPVAAEMQNFKPADALPYSMAKDVRPLPLSLQDLRGLDKLNYLKSKEKVYLVSAATAVPIVVDILNGK